MTTSKSGAASALDLEALALLISLRDNPEVQKDSAVLKLFNDAISFAKASTSFSTAATATSSSDIPQAMKAIPTNAAPTSSPFSLVPFIQIDTCGEDGDNGFLGTPGSSGKPGIHGTGGSDGKNAGDIHLQLMIRDETIAAQWDNRTASMKLGDPSASIFLHAAGGKGGNGGDGGRGGSGAAGAHGSNATRFSSGTNGVRGGNGGLGGNGGDGGNGGKGGDIKIHVSPEDSDLLMLLKPPEMAGGAKGKGGSKGKGGTGGAGGRGGSSHAWTETRNDTRQVYNAVFHTYRTEYRTTTISHFNPGGTHGSRRHDADNGRTGDDGKAGMNGSFQMIVAGKTYQTLYDLAITVSKIVDLTRGNPADIYEPGEEVNLMVSVINIGGMPTPSQDIEISLRPAQWIEQGNSTLVLTASEPLPVEGSHTFKTPFSFRVKDQASLTEESLNKQEEMTYHALLRRVNKSFSHISQQKDLFTVGYPVQISPIKGKISTVFNEKSTLSLFIQNITPVSMGKTGPQKRRIFVTFEIGESEGVKTSDVELLKMEEGDLQEPNKITVEVDHLSPKSNKELAVSFRFTNPDLTVQSKVGVVASLHLGYFNSENIGDLGRTRCIQKRTVQMQFC